MAKYITIIMKRTKISDETYIFNFDRIAVGELEKETEIFTDQDGNKYFGVSSEEAIEEDNQYSYAMIVDIEEVKDSLGENYLDMFENEYKNKIIIGHKKVLGDYHAFLFDPELAKSQENTLDEDPELDQSQEKTLEEDSETLKNCYEQVINVLDNSIDSYTLEELNYLKFFLLDRHNILDQIVERLIAEKSPKKRKRSKPIDPQKIYNKVTEVVVAQEQPARRIITEIAKKEKFPILKNKGIILTGESGIGKKELIRQIAKQLDKPLLEIDATQLSLITYVGIPIEQYLWDLYVNCDYDIDKTEQAIIYIEGIDKQGTPNQSNLSGQLILNELLPMIEGFTFDAVDNINTPSQSIKINTSKMIKIFDGTFEYVYNTLRINNNYGFGMDISSQEKYRNATTQDFINNSSMTEAFLDHNLVIRMNDLSAQDYKRILLESATSPLLKEQQIFNEVGVNIKFTEEYLNLISEKNKKTKDGVRGLFKLVENSVWMAYEEVISNPRKYKNNQYEVIITKDTIDDPSKYEINEVKGNEQAKIYQKKGSAKKRK